MPDIPITNYDPVLEHMKSLGIPLTRTNYVRIAGMVEPLEGEHEGYVICPLLMKGSNCQMFILTLRNQRKVTDKLAVLKGRERPSLDSICRVVSDQV